MGLGHDSHSLDGDGDPAGLEEVLDGHHVSGVLVLSHHGVEVEGVLLDHRGGVLLVDLDASAQSLGLGGQAERCPDALEALDIGLGASEFSHEVGVLVGLGPCGTDGVHLSEGGGLGEDGDRGPVQGLMFHCCEYSLSRSHCHDRFS